MNVELMLKLQAWVDGELPEGEARRLAELVPTDKEAAALVAELKLTRRVLAGNEPDVKLPESHEFYWSKIQRAIDRLDAQEVEPAATATWLVLLRRFLLPVSSFALVAFLTAVSIGVFQKRGIDDSLRHLVEVENLSEHVDSISYKSQSDNMFVVYVFNKETTESDFDDDEDDWDMEDVVIQ